MFKFKITYTKLDNYKPYIRRVGTRFTCNNHSCMIMSIDLKDNTYYLSEGMRTEIENSPGLLNGFEELVKSKTYVII